ncbi:uncharacterized protein Dvir_GJ26287 [Drosophila virilis]|uniref:Uncharacterized protein n=1 Tax=Drosophila virilis TaxID=7244 RepID=A0A0Q9WS94_DROVI|nr:uncharacterized protein Dvir_GJ26287 [Drosophila virilis]
MRSALVGLTNSQRHRPLWLTVILPASLSRCLRSESLRTDELPTRRPVQLRLLIPLRPAHSHVSKWFVSQLNSNYAIYSMTSCKFPIIEGLLAVIHGQYSSFLSELHSKRLSHKGLMLRFAGMLHCCFVPPTVHLNSCNKCFERLCKQKQHQQQQKQCQIGCCLCQARQAPPADV